MRLSSTDSSIEKGMGAASAAGSGTEGAAATCEWATTGAALDLMDRFTRSSKSPRCSGDGECTEIRQVSEKTHMKVEPWEVPSFRH